MILPPRTCLSAARLPVGCAPRRRYPAPAHVTGPRMQPIISIKALGKTYASGFQALKSIDLDIRRGEIFALLGPNGAGQTTLISIVCGIVTRSEEQPSELQSLLRSSSAVFCLTKNQET